MDSRRGAERAIVIPRINDGCIGIQMDGINSCDLTSKGNGIRKRWSLWKVIDVNECLMTTVIWRLVINGSSQTRMVCAMFGNQHRRNASTKSNANGNRGVLNVGMSFRTVNTKMRRRPWI